jgi:hypothetical protein
MKGFALIALCALTLAAAGCGGSGGGGPLSKADYQAQLTKFSTQVRTDQRTIAKAAQSAQTVAQLQAALRSFADSGDRFGDEIAKLKPPANAVAANAELARGAHDTAAATRAVIPTLTAYKTPQAAVAYLQSIGETSGNKEIKTALAKLKALGYKTGG